MQRLADAERAGGRTGPDAPAAQPRGLGRRRGDESGVPVRRRRLDQAARDLGRRGLVVGAIDETSQVKQGERPAGVKRHYLGCAGKVANGITTVHLAYAREGIGHALMAARQWTAELLIIDLALQPLDAIESAGFYQLCAERHQRASTVVTSNRTAS